MGVEYLSEEWATAMTEALNSSDTFKQAAGSNSATIQQVVTTGEGEKKYFFKMDGGQAEVGLGETENPDATVTQDYETSVALAKGELNGTAAYMSGKLKISGDLMKMMQLQGVFNSLLPATQDVDVDY